MSNSRSQSGKEVQPSAGCPAAGGVWFNHARYDGFGNKTQQTVTKGTGPSHSYSVDAATNRLGGFGFDGNGNVVSGLVGLPGTYSYDASNRLVDNNVEQYGYGASNQRLWKKRSDGVYEVYLYGLGGELLEVFEAQQYSQSQWGFWRKINSQRAWFGGRLMRVGSGAVNADRLGTYQGTYPYGELEGTVGAPGEKFATYFRDGTGLDYAVNRYYSSQMGRFLSADPYQASGGPANPGSWNRYAYVEDNPVTYHDPSGLLLRSPFCLPDIGCPGNPVEPCVPGFMPTGCPSGPEPEPLPPPPPKPTCGNANAQAFVESHFQDAAKVAGGLGIGGAQGDADILALSALESGWGSFTGGYPGAWFGMQGVIGAKLYPGETACIPIGGAKATACEMEFSSFGAAAAVFAQNKGRFVKDVSNPTQFFTNLHTKRAGFSQRQTLAKYLHDALPTQEWVEDCLMALGLVQ